MIRWGDEMLNEEQQSVVDTIDPFIFLLAGAGSGKTRVIIERMKRLVEKGVNPSKILAITFTRKASYEMKERMLRNDIAIHTFHQLSYIILKEQMHFSFEMVDEKSLFNYTDEHLLMISNYKNSLYKLKKPRIFSKYQEELKSTNKLDFDDLLIELLQVLKRNPTLLQYDYIFIDEFQDTNLLQYQLLKKIISNNTNVFAVGDPDQSIYQFRGATPKIIDLYIKEYHAVVYKLTLNYRSHKLIIKAANSLIKQNKRVFKKELIPTFKEDGIVQSYQFQTDEIEAKTIVETIKRLHFKGTAYSKIAILYRNHYRAYHIILSLHDNNIPFVLVDDLDNSNEGVFLMTIHQAKGLEFNVVMIIGCEERLLPSLKINQQSSLEEERRLMFVGMTRARHNLYLTHIVYDSENHHFTSSRFIRESGLKSINHQRFSDIISLGDNDGHKKTHG